MSGTLVGDHLDVTVSWSRPPGPVVGRYMATVSEGQLTGTAARQ
jgi:hypothetical protein